MVRSRFQPSLGPNIVARSPWGPATVRAWFQRYGVRRMIHGHTHRPAIHDEGDGRTRIVLGDWYEQGSVLRVRGDGVELASL